MTVRRLAFAAGLLAAIGFGAAGAAATPKPAAQASSGVRLVKIGSFSSPLYVTSPPGDTRRVMVVERDGRVWVMRDGRRLPRPFLDIRPLVIPAGEQGLLSVAFPPDYARSRRFYVYYSENNTANNKVVEYRRSATNPDRAVASSARTVLSMPDVESNHNGGLMLFRPDGLMYIGTGDGGGANDNHGGPGNGQNLGSLLGKILRIDPRRSRFGPYTIPRTNPFVATPGARPEIYSYGLRNPWRFSFDRATGDLAIGDVGQNQVEEVDFVRNGRARGANFGWRPFEGNRRIFAEPAPGAIAPVIAHAHAEGWCSVIGGYVVRDRALPGLFGRYVYADACEGRLRAARLRPGRAVADPPVDLRRVTGISSFGEDARGRFYVVSLEGPVYRLAAAR